MVADQPDPGRKDRLSVLVGAEVTGIRPAGGQHGVRHFLVQLADGRSAFVKEGRPGDDAQVAAEANGLRWLAAAAAVPVPRVLAAGARTLVLELIAGQRPDRRSAERFGRELAAMHAAGAARFGSPWPGFLAGLPLPDAASACGGQHMQEPSLAGSPGPRQGTAAGPVAASPAGGWPDWYARTRLLPFVRRARDAGTFSAADLRLVEAVAARIGELAGPAEPPSRIHGDCWAGNVLWSGGRGWLIDPAAHGGHRETDLAMLGLFGAPYLDSILAAYGEAAPLASGWRARVPLHQLHPLLVHVCLFGAAYRQQAVAAARAVLSG